MVYWVSLIVNGSSATVLQIPAQSMKLKRQKYSPEILKKRFFIVCVCLLPGRFFQKLISERAKSSIIRQIRTVCVFRKQGLQQLCRQEKMVI